jgi:GT2 family glycosyltransferase
MKLSVVCPTYNEIAFINTLVENLCYDDGLDKEVFIVDGGSVDGTKERVKLLMKKYPSLRLVENPLKTSTHAFNLGFGISTGDYVAFVGAHATYEKNYFTNGIKYLDLNECDAVGGPLKQEGKTPKAKAIANVMSSKLGVGNTEFRTESKKMYVDSVAFAIYRRKIIEQCGLMDESLPVNQDDEFHYRIKKMGFRILMVPEMSATYYVRDSYSRLSKQYFRYGLYKPAVLKKVSGSVRLRHVVPSLFTLYVLSLPVALLFLPWILPLLIYTTVIILKSMTTKAGWTIRFLSIPVFPILHLSYGTGFLFGLLRSDR